MHLRRICVASLSVLIAGVVSSTPVVTSAGQARAHTPASTSDTHFAFLPVALSAPASLPSAIIANRTVIDRFDQIPASAIQAASSRRVLQLHASTGNAVSSQGLSYLDGTRDGSPYPDYLYDRRNWVFEWWPDSMDKTFKGKVDQFGLTVTARHTNYDVFGMKLCYQDWFGLDFAYYRDRMLSLEQAYPNKKFIWWTQPIRNDWSRQQPGTCELLQNFNNNVRAYALAHNKPLVDIADIESHDPAGNPCFTTCETKCAPVYGTNPHPNPELAIRVAKAYWWALARMAGWDGN